MQAAVTPDVPVVIVGAGPTGLAAAILLARRGIASLVLERYRHPYPLPRAVHVDDEVRRILQDLGVADAFAQVSRPASGLRLLAADHRTIAEFRRHPDAGVHGHPQSTLFDQPDLERLLRAEVARHPQIEVRAGTQVTGLEQPEAGPVRVSYRQSDQDQDQDQDEDGDGDGHEDGDGDHVSAAAVLGCDGANSTVRELIGARLDDLGFEERWLVLDLRCRTPLPVWDGVEQVCDPRRAATAMRIGADRYRWEFRLHPGETVAALCTPDRLRALLAPWTGATPDADLEVLRAAEYTFRARLADRWRAGRVFLLGDAAHQTPPFVGQGLGSGLRDVHNLAWKLALVLTPHPADDESVALTGWPFGDQLLDTYQSERRPHARAQIRLAVLAGWAMTGGQDRAAALRRVLLAGVCRVPGASAHVLDRPGPALVTGPLVLRSGARERVRLSARARRPFLDPAGTLVPQPWVQVRGAPERQRLDDVLGPGFALLLAGPPDAGLRTLAARWHATVVRLDANDSDANDSDADDSDAGSARDTRVDSAQLRRWLAEHGTGAVLLRPDRVVLAAAPSARPGEPVGTRIVTAVGASIASHRPALLGITRPLG